MDAPKPILGVEQIQEELATLVSNNFKAVGIATGLVTTPTKHTKGSILRLPGIRLM